MRHITAEDLAGIPMKQFRKKPVIVEAQQIFLDYIIETLEGDMHAYAGSYIVRGVEGEIYPVKKEIFEKTYEEVLDANIIKSTDDIIYDKLEIIMPLVCGNCGKADIINFDDKFKCFHCDWFLMK